jgi:hypothetical protein
MDNNKVVYWVVGIIACIAGFFALNMFLSRPAAVINESEIAKTQDQNEVVSVDNVVIPDQASGSTVFVEKVLLKTGGKGGFVVVHRAKQDGMPGEIIGVSKYLEPGVTENLLVSLDKDIKVSTGDKLIGMIHADNGDKTWNDASADSPILNASGGIVMWKFNILAEEGLPGFEKKL